MSDKKIMGQVNKLKRKYLTIFSIMLILVIFVYINVTAKNPSNETTDKTNIVYNDLSPAQKLDIFYPDEKESNYPVVVYLHGGSYVSGDRNEHNDKNKEVFTANGYIYVPVGYRLSSEKAFPAAVDDAKTAIRYLKENAGKLKINKEKIYVMGFSAGANLGSMVISTKGTEALGTETIKYDGYNSNIAGFIGIAGFYDVNEYLNDYQSKNSTRERISKYYGSFNPSAISNNTNYIKNINIPVLLQHGKTDKVVNYMESIKYSNRIRYRSNNNKVICEIFQNKKHDYNNLMTASNAERIVEWLKSN